MGSGVTEDEIYTGDGEDFDVGEHAPVLSQEYIHLVQDGLSEPEFHQLAYLTDVLTVEQYETTVFTDNYEPDLIHGAYSPDLSLMLNEQIEEDEITSSLVMHGEITEVEMASSGVVAHLNREEPVDISSELEKIATFILTHTGDYDAEDLFERVRKNRVREETGWGENIDFDVIRGGGYGREFDREIDELPEELP